MEKTIILEKLAGIVAEYTGTDVELKDDQNLLEDVGLSSLDLMSIVGDVEDTFNVVIDDDEAVEIRTVGDLVTYISEQL